MSGGEGDASWSHDHTEPENGIGVAVVDEDPSSRDVLRALLATDRAVAWVREASGGAGAIDLVRRERPDVLFLGARTERPEGVELMREIQESERPAIVFVTTVDTLAIRAFDVGAVDYLLKPAARERFALALSRVKQRVRADAADRYLRLGGLGGAAEERPSWCAAPARRLVAKSVGRAVFIDLRDIEYIEADDYYALVHARGESHLVREPMRHLVPRLPHGFVRIHRSTVVNSAFVSELVTDDDGEPIVVIRSGARLRASRGRRERLLELLAEG